MGNRRTAPGAAPRPASRNPAGRPVRRRWAVLAAVAAIVLTGSAATTAALPRPVHQTPGGTTGPVPGPPARNVILVVGDGAGDALLHLARLTGQGPDGRLAVDALPASARVLTHSADSLVTDSAAAATAMATGHKTVNGAVGVDPQGRPLATVLERAQAAGKATGLVTTSFLADATPAAFAAHVPDRDDTTTIAAQILAAGVDVLLGGGEEDFLPVEEKGCHPLPGRRSDGRNLLAEARQRGYTVICRPAELEGLRVRPGMRVLGLFADKELYPLLYGSQGVPVRTGVPAQPALDGLAPGWVEPAVPTLAAMTRRALDVLARDPDGFFLLVEEEGTDGFGHAGLIEGAIAAAQGLDAAVGVALDFARRHPDTLLLVTGDHETGGLSIPGRGDGYSSDPKLPCPPPARPLATPQGQGFCAASAVPNHTGAPVPLLALGPGAQRVDGLLDNTDVARIIAAAFGWREER